MGHVQGAHARARISNLDRMPKHDDERLVVDVLREHLERRPLSPAELEAMVEIDPVTL